MAATALIKLTQGVTVGTPGQVLVGTTGTLVTIENNNNTGVNSWQIDLVYTPPGSAVPVATPLAFNNSSSTPTATFTPDVSGPYRIVLTVWDTTGRTGTNDSDIRNFMVPEPKHGLMAPPYQADPNPKPTLASGLPGAKPNETNIGGDELGWSGNGGDGLLTDLIRRVDASNFDAIPDLTLARPGDVLAVNGATGTVVTGNANHLVADSQGRVLINGGFDQVINRVPNTGIGVSEPWRPAAHYTSPTMGGKWVYYDSVSTGQRQWQVGLNLPSGGFIREILSDTPAIGLLEPVAGASLVDGETFTISDGTNTVTFEFDSNSIVTPGHVAVPFTGVDTITDVRDACVTAITGSTLNLVTTAAPFGPYVVLENFANRTAAANVPITWTVADLSFGAEGMQDGATGATYANPLGLDPGPVTSCDFDGTYIWTADGSNNIQKIDLSGYPWLALSSVWTWATGASGITRLRIDQNSANYGPPAKKGFYLDYGSGNVVRFNLGSPAAPEATAAALAPYGYGLAVGTGTQNGKIFVSAEDTVYKINVDLTTGLSSASTPLWTTGIDLGYDSTNNKLWVVAHNAAGNMVVARMNPSTLAVEAMTELSATGRNLDLVALGNVYGLHKIHFINGAAWVADPQVDNANGSTTAFFDTTNAAAYRLNLTGGSQKLTGTTGTWSNLTTIFYDSSANFVTAGVVPGDILVVEQRNPYGYILAPAGFQLTDGDTFTLDDGVNPAQVFEFDNNSIVNPGNIAVPFTSADQESTVQSNTITAINGAGLAITAYPLQNLPGGHSYNPWPFTGSSNLIALVNSTAGAAGNIPITQSMTGFFFSSYGMLGAQERVVYTISAVTATSLTVTQPLYGTGTAQPYTIFTPIPKTKVTQAGPKTLEFESTEWQDFQPVIQNNLYDCSMADGKAYGKYQKIGDTLKIQVTLVRGAGTNFGTGTSFFVPYPQPYIIDFHKLTNLLLRDFPYINLRVVQGLGLASPTLTPTAVFFQLIPPGLLYTPVALNPGTLLPSPGDSLILDYSIPIVVP